MVDEVTSQIHADPARCDCILLLCNVSYYRVLSSYIVIVLDSTLSNRAHEDFFNF